MRTSVGMRRCGGRRLKIGRLLLPAAAVLLWLAAQPANAQGWDGGFHFFPFFDHRPQSQPMWPWQQPQAAPEPRPQIDYSKAPPPKKSDTVPTTNIVVMGDAMADWLAYGLEDAFSESPEIGVARKHRTYSGLIHGDSKNAYDWPQAARDILAAEKADFVVMMIGMSDRQAIREKPARGNPAKPNAGANAARGAGGANDAAAHDDEAQPAPEDSAAAAAPEPTTHGGTSVYEFRSEQWAERYAKHIDEMIAVLKSKGAQVFWVGLPSLRGTRSTSDIAYLNALYRSHAEKAGITFVDVWDGFVDENGNFTTHGPDFEGQTRRLRSADGVYFTKAGAQKLAHYVEREIRHAMLTHNGPLATPVPEEPAPQTSAHQGAQPAARPIAGPVVPLTKMSGTQDELLGGGPARTPAVDQNTTKVLVKGEPPASLTGRADDFAWPRSDAAAPAVTPAAPAPASVAPAAAAPPPATGGESFRPALPAKDSPADASSPPKSSPAAKPAQPSEAAAEPPKRVHRPIAARSGAPRASPQASPMADDGLRPPALIPSR